MTLKSFLDRITPFLRKGVILLFILITTQMNAFDKPIAVYLTWQHSPESTITISWITQKNQTNNLIEYLCEGHSSWKKATGLHRSIPQDQPYLVHTTELTDLLPNTTYLFRINSEGPSYKFKTMPTVLSKEGVVFVVGGDMYHDTVELLHETNHQAAKTCPQFALIGGDIAYAAGRKLPMTPGWLGAWFDKISDQKFDRWLVWIKAWSQDMITPEGCLIPLLPVLGNHDVNGGFNQTPAEAPFFYALFSMPGPQGYNVLDFGNYMSIFLLDSGHTHPINGLQTSWLETALKERTYVPHKFALYHVPAYPSVRAIDGKTSTLVRNNWVPIFDQYQLTAAFENHDHDYKRTYCLSQGKIDAKGVLYLGDGAWGVDKPRKVRERKEKWYLFKTAHERHFIKVSLKEDEQRVTAIKSDGTIFDEFLLNTYPNAYKNRNLGQDAP